MIKITRASNVEDLKNAVSGNWGVNGNVAMFGRAYVSTKKPDDYDNGNWMTFTSDEGVKIWVKFLF